MQGKVFLCVYVYVKQVVDSLHYCYQRLLEVYATTCTLNCISILGSYRMVRWIYQSQPDRVPAKYDTMGHRLVDQSSSSR